MKHPWNKTPDARAGYDKKDARFFPEGAPGYSRKKAIIKNRNLETYLLLLPLPIDPHAPFFLPSPQPPYDRKRPLRRRQEAEYTPQGQGHTQPGVCPGRGGAGGFQKFPWAKV